MNRRRKDDDLDDMTVAVGFLVFLLLILLPGVLL